MSHFVLLENLAVHHCDFDCPHIGDHIENKCISPKLIIQYILAVLLVGKRSRKLDIFNSDSICLSEVVLLHHHNLLPVCYEPVSYLMFKILCQIIGEILLFGQVNPQPFLDANIHAISDTTLKIYKQPFSMASNQVLAWPPVEAASL